jgi:hypothetical protein
VQQVPFTHEDLDLKKKFLDLANNYQTKALEYSDKEDGELSLAYALASALLYMNTADYLAEYLVKNISTMLLEATNHYYFGAVAIKPQKFTKHSIGRSITELKKYEFARKNDVIEKLTEINTARNRIAHQILKTKASDLEEIDKSLSELSTKTQELVEIIDQIQIGMPPRNLSDEINKLVEKLKGSNG